ncbi:MAG: branched-chain amino acid ABC transporter permease [Actinomycetota bacterium]|nr:branched-chain amino acid ABC transporter permease [Actinomycetota bacterium]
MDDFFRILVIALLLGGIYGLVAMGLSLIFGVIRVVNFAQGELVMLGMYGAYFAHTQFGLNVYVTVFLVVPVLFVIGVLIQRLIIQPLRDEAAMQLLATFGLLILFQSLVLAGTRGDTYTLRDPVARDTFTLYSANIDYGRLLIVVVTTAIAIGLRQVIQKTTFGRSMRAVTEDRDAARLMGVNVERTFLYTFGIGAALAGLAGVMLAPVYSITPQIGGNFIFAAFAVVVVGGLGSVTGAYIGGFLIGAVEAFSGYYLDPTLGTAFYFLVFLVVLVVRPAGLFGRVGSEKVGGH